MSNNNGRALQPTRQQKMTSWLNSALTAAVRERDPDAMEFAGVVFRWTSGVNNDNTQPPKPLNAPSESQAPALQNTRTVERPAVASSQGNTRQQSTNPLLNPTMPWYLMGGAFPVGAFLGLILMLFVKQPYNWCCASLLSLAIFFLGVRLLGYQWDKRKEAEAEKLHQQKQGGKSKRAQGKDQDRRQGHQSEDNRRRSEQSRNTRVQGPHSKQRGPLYNHHYNNLNDDVEVREEDE